MPLYNAAAQDDPAPAYESHAVAEHADNQDAEAVAAAEAGPARVKNSSRVSGSVSRAWLGKRAASAPPARPAPAGLHEA